MLCGPWKDATLPVLTLHVDDNYVNRKAITLAISYLYGNHPKFDDGNGFRKLDDGNVFRVLAVASFLDLHELLV